MTAVVETSARTLVPPDVFARLVRRIVADEGADPTFAERIMDQALAFLGACAAEGRGAALVPSATVDIGWHAFLLHTKDYAAFCERVPGFFIHHVPTEGDDEPGDPTELLARTVTAIRNAGYAVDPDLWLPVAGSCGPCHEDGNCAASGTDGNENSDKRTK